MPRRCRGGPCARPGGGKPLPYIFIAAIVLLAGCKSKPAPLQLQDPFKLENGGRVETAAQWPGRRAEILKLLEREQYGSVPSPPTKIAASLLSEEEIFDGYALRRKVRLTMTGPKGTLSFTVGLTLPKETGPFPALVHIDHRPELHTCTIPQEIVARGYILAEFTPTDLCPDTPSGSGPARTAFGKGTWGTISCWAWGAARVLDHLLGLQQVDTKRIAVTGHSRSGKAALWAGALDTRFALTVPQGSGCGGAGSYRLRGPGSERLQDLSRNFPHWFRSGLARYAGAEDRLPYDQHFVLALIAPRALLTIDAAGDAWANPYGTSAAHLGARPVYKFLRASERIGITLRPGKHELADTDWRTLMDFADRVFDRPPQPGSAGRDFSKLPRNIVPAPFSWKRPGRR